MEFMVDSRCGLHCTGCEYKETCGCGGCIETNGHPFHGECPVAVCCQNKGIVHCGGCPDIPCELLTRYSCDPEQATRLREPESNSANVGVPRRKKRIRMWSANRKFRLAVSGSALPWPEG